MFRLSTALSLAIVLLASNAFANATATGDGDDIPDNEVAGYSSVATIGSAKTVQDVSVTVEGLFHTWGGDLLITLEHGGTTVDLVNRIGEETGPPPTCCGTSDDFAGDYTFQDGGADIWLAPTTSVAVGTGTVTAITPGGPYNPSTNNFDGVATVGSAAPIVSMTTLADAFGGMDASGDWTLLISDGGAQDTGTFASWTVNITSIPEPASFSLIGLGFLALLGRRRR